MRNVLLFTIAFVSCSLSNAQGSNNKFCTSLSRLVNLAGSRFLSITNTSNPKISILGDTTFATAYLLDGSKSSKIVRSGYDEGISYIASMGKGLQGTAAETLVQKLQKNIGACVGNTYLMKKEQITTSTVHLKFISKQEVANERLPKPQVWIEKMQLENGRLNINVMVNTPKQPAISDDFLDEVYETDITKGRVTIGLCNQLKELLSQAPLKFKEVRNSNYRNDDGTQIYPASYKLEGSLSSEIRISPATYSHETRIADKTEKTAALVIFKAWIQKVKACLGTNYVFFEGVEEGRFYICTVRSKNDNDAASKIDLECRPNRDGSYYVDLKVYRYAD